MPPLDFGRPPPYPSCLYIYCVHVPCASPSPWPNPWLCCAAWHMLIILPHPALGFASATTLARHSPLLCLLHLYPTAYLLLLPTTWLYPPSATTIMRKRYSPLLISISITTFIPSCLREHIFFYTRSSGIPSPFVSPPGPPIRLVVVDHSFLLPQHHCIPLSAHAHILHPRLPLDTPCPFLFQSIITASPIVGILPSLSHVVQLPEVQ